MTTPARLGDAPEPLPPYTSAEVASGFGWMLMTGGAVGMLIASWTLFGTAASGMWAGYRDQTLCVVVLIAAMSLRSSLAKVPSIGAGIVCGIGLILFGALLTDPFAMVFTEILFGVVIVAGSVLQAGQLKD